MCGHVTTRGVWGRRDGTWSGQQGLYIIMFSGWIAPPQGLSFQSLFYSLLQQKLPPFLITKLSWWWHLKVATSRIPPPLPAQQHFIDAHNQTLNPKPANTDTKSTNPQDFKRKCCFFYKIQLLAQFHKFCKKMRWKPAAPSPSEALELVLRTRFSGSQPSQALSVHRECKSRSNHAQFKVHIWRKI